jgi:hypothetical protein
MKRTSLTQGCIGLLICNILYALTPTPYLAFRSQGQYALFDLVALSQHINKDVPYNYATYAITPRYTQSFFQNRIADNLFGNDLISDTLSAINISGSAVTTRDADKDWLADYFGLPRDHSGTIRFEPVISNFTMDLYGYFGLNCITPGLFATVHIPVVRTKANLHFFEAVITDGIANYPPGYLSSRAQAEQVGDGMTTEAIGIKRANLLNNAADFLFWQQTPTIDPTRMIPLRTARMTPDNICNNKVRSGIADIQTVIGYNFIQERWCHLGAGLRAVIPTGTRPNGQFIFEPVLGNGRHWELGAQLWGHRTFCMSENEEKQWAAYFIAHIMHMFNARQCRTFDLVCKPNSRWMLAEQFSPAVQQLVANQIPDNLDPQNLVTPDAQFAGLFSPVANLTSRRVHVRSMLQCDAVFMLNYITSQLNIDFGYNIWYRSCEKITKNTCGPTPLQSKLWALKGDSYVYGFTYAQIAPPIENNTPVALSATQSNATIHGGTNNFIGLDGNNGGINGIRPTRNPGVDNAAFAAAVFNNTPVFVNDRITTAALTDAEQTMTSYNPVFISEDQLDLCNASTRGLSNTLFFNLSYNIDAGNVCYIPFIGFGFALEIGNQNLPQNCAKNKCQNCASSQFSVWLRAGAAFD